MSFHIRPAQAQDIIHIMHIYNREIENGLATWNNISKSLEEYQQWFADLEKNNFPLFVAEEVATQRIAGYAEYSSFRNFNGYKHTVEHAVYIDPQFARQGLGKALLLTLIKHAQQQKIHVMIAAIDHENKGSIHLHEQLGFKHTGYMPQVGQKFGQWRDLVLMQLLLDRKIP
ncbi:GNAT family N-acetyltransferase [Acinetobacter sp. CFCC 10889]|uniref:GNAT family N-acetyltransferase n=1 Tax=Acinetobacter sp. CFCC 10889 TaxID=1775557 RepID=UPI000DD095FC|nr:GNAT family N-acetyltransferase [Acinetobacter sp. CFCC 10889]